MLLNVKFKRFEKKKFLLIHTKNDFILPIFNNLSNFYLHFGFEKFFLKKITYLLTNIFSLNQNVLFVDFNINYNYLPVDNKIIFSRSFSKLHKYIKYFNIGLVFYKDLKKKKFIFNKLFTCNLINVSLTNEFVESKFDLNLNIKNNLHFYVFYLFVINTYLKVKNKT